MARSRTRLAATAPMTSGTKAFPDLRRTGSGSTPLGGTVWPPAAAVGGCGKAVTVIGCPLRCLLLRVSQHTSPIDRANPTPCWVHPRTAHVLALLTQGEAQRRFRSQHVGGSH